MMIKKLDKITLNKYLHLQDEEKEVVDFIIQEGIKENENLVMKGSVFKPFDMWNISYNNMIFIKENLQGENFLDCIKLMYGIGDYHLEKATVFNIFSVYQYLINKLQEIIQIENDQIDNEKDPDEENAGIGMFEKYGFYNEIRSLTDGDKTKEDYYLNLPYIDVFLELTYKSNLIKFSNKLQEIKNKKK